MRLKLGQILLQAGLLTQATLNQALDAQKQSGARLGDILIGHGHLNYLSLYKAIAAHYELPFVNLTDEPCDVNLLSAEDAEAYLHYRAMPWKQRDDLFIIAVTEFSEETERWLRARWPGRLGFVITSPLDIKRNVEHFFSTHVEARSRNLLAELFPSASAKLSLTRGQANYLGLGFTAFLLLLLISPRNAGVIFIASCQFIYAATLSFKMLLFVAGMKNPKVTQPNPVTIPDYKLPIYSILVPMYQEPESLGQMLDAIHKLDYPAAKLDVKILLEADDDITYQAALAAKPRYQFDIIRIPKGDIRTKPRALNYGLRFARGEYVTVYDADDQPEPGQLKKAIAAFYTLPRNIACLQSRLNYYNWNDNWLTRSFALEYTMLFNVLLPGLHRLEMPIPLGGTSNHIALKRLREMGDWDAYNVTEDADLGTRLAANGYQTMMLDSGTMEEAPNAFGNWLRQRSRWIKGYMQTWLVHMRHPLSLSKTLKMHGFLGFQFFMGLSTLTYLTTPIALTAGIAWIILREDVHFPAWLIMLSIINLLLNFITHWFTAIISAFRAPFPSRKLLPAALLYPAYQLLHIAASYKALWQLCRCPHFWEKTRHGLAKTRLT